MHLKIESLLDRIGLKILKLLQRNGRLSYSQIGRAVGLSAPAAAERVKKLEDAGIIKGYHAVVDPDQLGQAVPAFIHLSAESVHYPRVKALASTLSEVVACHHVSGDEAFIIKVRTGSVSELEQLVKKFSVYGRTKTSVILSTSVDKSINH